MKINFSSLQIIMVFIICSVYLFSQETGIPINTAQKFNERGFNSSSSSMFDNNEIIGDYDGNLSLLYNIHYEMPNDMGFDLSVIYNANVAHKTFWNHIQAQRSGYSINKPAWIIGIKNLALLTTNFEVNFYISEENNLLTGEKAPALIPGYHYTNRNLPFENGNLEGYPTNDFIELLRSDGSILSLYNEAQQSKTGRYVESSSDGYGYAIVQMLPNNQYLRRMWYKPGDGLTYYFEEETAKYNGRDFNASNFTNPKIMYLKEITSNSYDTLKIEYYEWDEYPMEAYFPGGFGRKIPKQIWTNRRIKTETPTAKRFSIVGFQYRWLDYGWETDLMDMDIVHQFNHTQTQLIFKHGTGSSIFSTDRSDLNTSSKTKYITGIIDEIGRYNTIDYGVKYRKFLNGSLNYPLFRFEVPVYLPQFLNYYNGKKVEYTYKTPPSTVEYYRFSFNSPGSECNQVNLSNMDVVNSTYRDDFTNYMVSKRKVRDTYPTNHIVFEDSYSYIWNSTSNYNMCNGADNIITSIVKTSYSNDGSSPNTTVVRKNFSKFLVSYKPHPASTSDWGAGVIRLVSEATEVDYANKIEKINSWDVNNTYSNMYWLTSTQEKITEDQISSSKTTNYIYESISAIVPNKNVMTKRTSIDHMGLKTEEGFNSSFIPPSNSIDISEYYKLGITNYNKVFQNTDIKSFDSYTYFSDGEFKGKIHTFNKNNHYKPISVTYDYYSLLEDTSYFGLLKSQSSSNGIISQYCYPRFRPYIWEVTKYLIVADTIQAYKTTTDGQKVMSQFVAKNYSTKPFVTKILYNNNNDTLISYTSYDSRGNLLFEVDVNGIYSEYVVDNGGRLLRAKLPGSFFPGSQLSQDSTFIIQNYAPYANRQFTISSEGDLTTSWRFISYNTGGGALPDGGIIQEDAESEEGEGDELIGNGGGGGGGNQTPEPNYDFFIFFQDTIALNNIYELYFATLTFKTGLKDITEGLDNNFKIHGITQKYDGNINYETIGEKTVSFVDTSLMTIDMANIIQACITNGKNLFGFKFTTDLLQSTEEAHKRFNFSQEVAPSFNASFRVFNSELSNARSTAIFSYDDVGNKLTLIKRFSHNPQDDSKLRSQMLYDSFGQLRKTSVENSIGVFESKKETKVNYLNLVADEKDGENRNVYYSYDNFQRVDTVYFENPGPNAQKQAFEYAPLNEEPNQFQLKTIKDGENKLTKIYYLKNGAVDYEERTDGTNTLTTNYNYDNLYRLTSVVSPSGKVTSYVYDEHSNIKQKTSPDEGTIKYRYDKYGNLRFSLNTGAGATEKALMFTKYDQFKRQVATGLLISTFGIDLLNPDLDYSVNQGSFSHFENTITDTANFVVVNMYDKYNKTGVFINMPNPHLESFIKSKNLKGKLVATAFRDKPGQSWSYKVYTYDYLGRVNYYWVKMANKNWKVVINEYDNLGNITKQSVNNEFFVWNDYDEQGRLKEVRSNIHNAYTTAKLDAVYTYDKSDKITSVEYGSRVKPVMNYTYDTKGRLIDLDGIATDMFNTQFKETITYYDNDNIHTQLIRNNANENWANLNFTYTYDAYNRLIGAACNNTSYTENYTYDNDGNFNTKNRSGLGMVYNYLPNTNKLNYVKINNVNKYYAHDYRGNIISDGYRGVFSVTYDRRNLILSFYKNSQTNNYRYDDAGQRIYKGVYNQTKEYYFRDHTGKELGVYDLNTGRLKMLNLYGNGLMGKVNVMWDSTWTETDPGTWEYIYDRTDERNFYFKDHLGSIRMILDEASEIVGAQDYYPYGSILRSYTTGADINSKYKFTEKERDVESGYDYFGARYYDSDLARWLQVDPLSAQRPSLSPFNYCQNNPLLRIDPTGMLDTRLEFDEGGNLKNIVDDGKAEVTGAIVNKDNKIIKSFDFNDLLDTAPLLSNGGVGNTDGFKIDGLNLSFNENSINSLLENADIFNQSSSSILSNFVYALTESPAGGKMDFLSHIKSDPNKLIIIGNTAYNKPDAGNYIWGAAMSILGFDYQTATLAANAFALYKHQNMDSFPDLKAIGDGHFSRR